MTQHIFYTKDKDGEIDGVMDHTGCYFCDHPHDKNLANVGIDYARKTVEKLHLRDLMIGWLLFNYPDMISLDSYERDMITSLLEEIEDERDLTNELHRKVETLKHELRTLRLAQGVC